MNNPHKLIYCYVISAVLAASLAIAACAQKELPSAQKKALRYPVMCAVLKKYGKPKNDTQSRDKRTRRFETDYTVTKDIINYAAEFHFLKDHLVYVRLENGE